MESLSTNEQLNASITTHETEMAAKVMRKGKSLSLNGILPKFYVTFRPLIGPLLVDMTQFSLEIGCFSRDVNTALITLLLINDKDAEKCVVVVGL